MADISQLTGVGFGNLGIEEIGIGLLIMIVIILVWKLIWYGIAIYKTIERKQLTWFVVLFVAAFLLGDLGILAIIYLLIYRQVPEKAIKKKVKKK